nr:hypothetical protein [Tanacetum cinerariifolium]
MIMRVINSYKEVDLFNRPPPTFDEETEFAPPVIPIADVDDVPIPPVIHFGHNFYIGVGSSSRALLVGNSEVNAPGLITCDLESVRGVATRLDKQMFDRYRTEKKMEKKFKEDEFHMNGHEYDIIALDVVNRRAEYLSHWEARIKGRIYAELRFKEEPPIYTAFAPRANDPYVMNHASPKGTSAAAIQKLVVDKVVEALGTDRAARNDPNVAEGSGGNGGQGGAPPNHAYQEDVVIAIQKLVVDKVARALAADRVARNDPNVAEGSGGNGGAQLIRECSFDGFMKCGPTQFHGHEGAVELCRWFEKTESVFDISECAERRLVAVNKKSWNDMKKMMLEEFCPSEEIQRLENELRGLKLRDTNIAAYTQWFNDLALLCPKAVPSENKKVELYIKGLLEIIKGETTSSRPAVLNDVVRRALTWWNTQVATLGLTIVNKKSWNDMRKMMLEEFCPSEEIQRLENELKGLKLRDTNIAAYTQQFNELALLCPEAVPSEKEIAELYINGLPENIKEETTSSRTTVLNDAVLERNAVIVYGKKEEHIPVKNEVLVVKGNEGVSRLKVISCIKARKTEIDLPRSLPSNLGKLDLDTGCLYRLYRIEIANLHKDSGDHFKSPCHQKSYADVRRKPMEFSVGDMVMLMVSPWKGLIHFGKRGKLSP